MREKRNPETQRQSSQRGMQGNQSASSPPILGTDAEVLGLFHIIVSGSQHDSVIVVALTHLPGFYFDAPGYQW